MSREYHKIHSIFERDSRTKVFTSAYARPEFEYLKDNVWEWTEKIDGTNIRVIWKHDIGVLSFRGRTDNAQIPAKLIDRLQELFRPDDFDARFQESDVVLYGEGFGAGIQKGGKRYLPDSVDFILFDVLVEHGGQWWLNRPDVDDVADRFGIKSVSVVGQGPLIDAVAMARGGFRSAFGDFLAEGLVLRPQTQLFCRTGERIITKVKHNDFKRDGKP